MSKPNRFNRKVEIKDKKRSYTYKTLKDCEVGDMANFYAVVLDATYPHQSFKSKKFLVTFKVADHSCRMGNDGVADFTTVVFFADKQEDLPVCNRIGDIIRVHRATVGTYKDRKQITANVCFNSSWALFPLHVKGETQKGGPDRNDEFNPFSFFGKSIQIELNEHKILRELRKWAIKAFETKPVLSNQFIFKLNMVNEATVTEGENGEPKCNDFDIQVKIVQLMPIDQYKSEIRVIDDSNEIWHAQIYNRKFPMIREGDYVRIRQATLFNVLNKGYQNTFTLRHQSNILRLPYPCKQAEDMFFDETAAMQEFEV